MIPELKTACLNRLKTVRGHLDAVLAMVEEERHCPQVMKQVSALQAALEKVNRLLLENHLQTCVPRAVAEGRSGEIVDELLETIRYSPAVTGPRRGEELEAAPELPAAPGALAAPEEGA